MSKVYDIITQNIIKMLEDGQIPWNSPWIGKQEMPANLKSKQPYNGINWLVLSLSAMKDGFTSPYWLTFKQIKAAGGQLQKNSKSARIVFWKREERKEDDDRFICRYYCVFNTDQCDDLDVPVPTRQIDFTPIEQAEKLISGYKNPPTIKNGGFRSFYRRSEDLVQMPEADFFASKESYYSVLFHELTHSTAHKTRLDRPLNNRHYAIEGYSKEELIAELGAAFLCNRCKIETDQTKQNNAAYIQNWLKALKNDTSLIVSAASKAQKAVNLITSKECTKWND